HENARVNGHPKAAELCPADDVLEWQPFGTLADHGAQSLARGRRRDQQRRLLCSEHASGGAQRRRDRVNAEATIACARAHATTIRAAPAAGRLLTQALGSGT